MLITWAQYDTNSHPAAFQMSRTTTSCAQTSVGNIHTETSTVDVDALHVQLHLAVIITRCTDKLMLIREDLGWQKLVCSVVCDVPLLREGYCTPSFTAERKKVD